MPVGILAHPIPEWWLSRSRISIFFQTLCFYSVAENQIVLKDWSGNRMDFCGYISGLNRESLSGSVGKKMLKISLHSNSAG